VLLSGMTAKAMNKSENEAAVEILGSILGAWITSCINVNTCILDY
jgi:hypothetical protein